jgi:hypothetical protein
MILETVFGLTVIVSVSLDRHWPAPQPPPPAQLSVHQRDAALMPLVHDATACILRAIEADPRSAERLRRDEINDLIVDAMVVCDRPLRAVIDSHDRMFGQGSSEAFLLGPYLDVLPAAVVKQVRLRSQAR